MSNPKSKFQSKNLVLTKKLNNVIYEMMVKTNSDMVYVNEDTTLTEKLYDISELFTKAFDSYDELKEAYDELTVGSVEGFKSFKEIYDYVNINGNPESELIKLIKSKQDAVDGKGLSTNDFTDILYEKLVHGYSKEELNDKFKIVFDKTDELSKKILKHLGLFEFFKDRYYSVEDFGVYKKNENW